MLTYNGKMYLKPLAGNNNRYFKDTNGNTNWAEGQATLYQQENYYLWIELGTDTTTPSLSDYQWAHGVSGLTTTSQGNSCYDGQLNWGDTTILSATKVVKNNTVNDITVNEVGLFTKNGYYTAQPSFLLAREVFDEPVIIHPGESKQFSIII